MTRSNEPAPFNAYEFLDRITGQTEGDHLVFLSNEYRATDLGLMLKTALRAIELLAEKVNKSDA